MSPLSAQRPHEQGSPTGREAEVRASGRGAAHRLRTARLWLTDENGPLTTVTTDAVPAVSSCRCAEARAASDRCVS
ncbi:hypothetical protein ACGF13_38580 [Kitasatospora sp. NPDC048286]|uniref:hypothetical protein n=1 Tax=Kitasatospora sp. NPDC048286 TaxID=3364047 RepID=UPI0037215F75